MKAHLNARLTPGFLLPALALASLAPTPASAQEWIPQSPCTGTDMEAVWFTDASTGWAVGSLTSVFRTDDGGNSWVSVNVASADLFDVTFSDPSSGLIVGLGGLILRTSDGGDNWGVAPSNTTGDLRAVAMGAGGTAYAAGTGVILRSVDSGASWTIAEAGALDYHALAASGTSAWVVGSGGLVRVTTDAGVTWSAQASGTSANLRGVHFLDGSEGWIAGDGNTVLHTANAGAVWTPRSSGILGDLRSVHFVSALEGYVVGVDDFNGVIYHTVDGGLSWGAEDATWAHGALQDVFFANPGSGWTVGSTCTILSRSATPTGAGTLSARAAGLSLRLLDNPATGTARIRYALPSDTTVRLRIVDVQGRVVATLVDRFLPEGSHEARWPSSSGVYLAVLETEHSSLTTKFVVLR